MRVAVTGGLGFIGNYVCQEIERRGYQAVPIDRNAGVDILDKEAHELLKSCDAVIHLAGVLGTDELFDEAEHAIEVNVTGTYKVLKACQEFELAYVGITMPQCWDNIYQATKLAAGKIASAFNRHYGVSVSHVRAFNVFGPGQKVGRPQKIIPTFSDYAWRGEPLPVWGDGEQLVDMVYITDVAHMLVDALSFGGNQVFDAGTAVPLRVIDVARLVWYEANPGTPTAIDFKVMRRGEHGPGVIATKEGWDLLGWGPRLKTFELRETVQSYRSRA